MRHAREVSALHRCGAVLRPRVMLRHEMVMASKRKGVNALFGCWRAFTSQLFLLWFCHPMALPSWPAQVQAGVATCDYDSNEEVEGTTA